MGLVGCVKQKRHHAAPARDLYVSQLFRSRRTYVEASCDRWYVLSALHGLVTADTVLEPYDKTLNGASVAAKRAWAAMVVAQLEAEVDVPRTTFELHAGAQYADFGLVDGLRHRGATVVIPTAHLAIGEQLAFYKHRGRIRRTARPAAGAYEPIAGHLTNTAALTQDLTFAQIEELLGRSLPASARRHRAWWSNATGAQTPSSAWMSAGWLVDTVDLAGGHVRFRRSDR